MRLLKMQRYWRIKLLFAGMALSALIIVGGRSLAQMRQIDQPDREERRLERKVEKLEEAFSALQLNNEKRLTVIETQVSNAISMLAVLSGVIGLYLAALIGRGARDWVLERRAHNGKSVT